jgi:hypothetical protein
MKSCVKNDTVFAVQDFTVGFLDVFNGLLLERSLYKILVLKKIIF